MPALSATHASVVDVAKMKAWWQEPRGARIRGMTAEELLLREAPHWTEDDAEVALRAVEREDPLLRAIAIAPEDDEPWTDEDEAAMAAVEADRAAGVPTIPFEEIKRKYGYP